MQYPGGVAGRQGVGDSNEQLDNLLPRPRCRTCPFFERAAIDELGYQVVPFIELADIMDRVLRASASDPDAELSAPVPDKGYREAFLNLSRNLAPTGKMFDRLEIRDASAPALELQVTSRRDLNTALKNIRPPVLDDVVGPMVNHQVIVTAVRRKGKLVYQDIEAEE